MWMPGFTPWPMPLYMPPPMPWTVMPPVVSPWSNGCGSICDDFIGRQMGRTYGAVVGSSVGSSLASLFGLAVAGLPGMAIFSGIGWVGGLLLGSVIGDRMGSHHHHHRPPWCGF